MLRTERKEKKFFPMPSHPVAEIVIMCFPCDRETLIMAKEVTMMMIMVNDEDDNRWGL